MEFLSMVLSEDNIRTLVILVAIACASIWQEKRLDAKMDKRFNENDAKMDKKFNEYDTKMDKKFNEYDAKMDKKFNEMDIKFDAFDKSIDKRFESFYQQLKTNDFTHLNNSISELTFILEKNGFLKVSDREHINSKLDK